MSLCVIHRFKNCNILMVDFFPLLLPYIFWLVRVLTLFCLILKMSKLSWFLSFYWEYLFPPLYPDVMSVLDVQLYFLDPEEGNILFSFYSVSLVFLWGNWGHWCWDLSLSSIGWFLLLWWCDVNFPPLISLSDIIHSLCFLGFSWPL